MFYADPICEAAYMEVADWFMGFFMGDLEGFGKDLQ